MPVGDIIESVFCHFGHAQNSLNVMHWRVQTVTGTEPTATEKADALSTFWATNVKTIMSAQFSYKGIKYRLLSPTATAVIVRTTGAGAGSLAGDALPPQLCGLLSLRSSFAPPRVRGRMYLPPATENENGPTGELTAGYVTNLGTFWGAVVAGHTLTGAGGNVTVSPVIWRRAPISTFFVIDSVLVRTVWATQRRRSATNRGDTSAI